jgi:methyl-accepting chemotaxis protein
MWTFGKKLAAGFAIPIVLLAAIGTVSYRALDSLTSTSYLVTHTHAVIEHVEHVISLLKDTETGQRGFVITGDEAFLEPYVASASDIPKVVKDLRELTRDNPNQQKRLDDLEPLITQKLAELKRTIDLRRSAGFEPTQKIVASGEGKRTMDQIRLVLGQMDREERDLLRQRADEVEAVASGVRVTILLGTGLCLLLTLAVGFILVRTLSGQIGSAVGQVQSSSSELQAAANQQVTGAKEQATAMNEITTTISELLATSRQIAESARRVAQIADQTATAARAGDGTVGKAHDAIGGIRHQVDLIVTHMLELGKKSQQIGAVLDIVAELAEQTNILAINATIEAAVAGDSGKRFAVVADEIRKLADRVAGSTKEVRALIDDVRSAVNTTVMATETGSKSVDTGTKHFGDVASSFKQIAGLVTTTTEAGREIELSTKQQTTAVEQVNVAIANVAQASKETEASSTQTLQTASQLAGLSKELLRLIEPRTSN